MARFTELAGDPQRTRGIARAGLDVLLATPAPTTARVASIGYCFGGTMSLELARAGTDLACVVGFHSGLAHGRAGGRRRHHRQGARHTSAPRIRSSRPSSATAFEQEMRAGGADWRMYLYGGAVHSFTNPAADGSNPAIRYDAVGRRPLVAGDARPLRRGLLSDRSASDLPRAGADDVPSQHDGGVRVPGVGVGHQGGDRRRQRAGARSPIVTCSSTPRSAARTATHSEMNGSCSPAAASSWGRIPRTDASGPSRPG